MFAVIMSALLATGVVFVYWGFQPSNAIASSLSTFFTGLSIDQTVLYVPGGAVLIVMGLAGLLWHLRRRLQ